MSPRPVLLLLAALGAAPLGAQGQRLNEPFVLAESDVFSFDLDARGRNFVFAADGDVDGVNELYGGPSDYRHAPRKLNGVLVPGGDVTAFALARDGSRAVYRADQAVDEVQELYSVPLAGAPVPVRLSPDLAPDRDVTDFAISADSTRVVFLANARAAGSFELWSAPLDGSQPAVLLQPLTGSRDTLDFSIAPDSSRVVLRSDPSGVAELFSVPIDGSAAPVKLNGTLVQFGSVQNHQISPDSTRVVYLADQTRAGVFDLFAAPLDGSAAAVRLNERLPANGDVTEWTITPDARHVVFLADASQDTIFELHLTDFAGNHSVVLDPGLAPGGIVRDFFVSPDGRHVAFRAEVEASDQIDLFCAPLRRTAWLEGRRPVAQVSGPLVANGDVRLAAFAGERVIYMADQEVDSRIEVYSAPVTGNQPPLKLNQPFTTTGVSVIEVADDGLTVVYRAESGGAPQLFSVPADGSRTPRRLSGALVSGGAVFPGFELRGPRIFYRADQELDGVVELYSSFLTRPHLPR